MSRFKSTNCRVRLTRPYKNKNAGETFGCGKDVADLLVAKGAGYLVDEKGNKLKAPKPSREDRAEAKKKAAEAKAKAEAEAHALRQAEGIKAAEAKEAEAKAKAEAEEKARDQ